jgi:hypothetical protein
MEPPCHAVVLSIDEKSQIQALDRTQPGLPLKPGKCATMTHDYKRNGTTTLFAALNVLDGTVLGRCMKRHRHQEFIKFLNAVEQKVPAGKIKDPSAGRSAERTEVENPYARSMKSKPGRKRRSPIFLQHAGRFDEPLLAY